jgi:hypothetical protein
MDIYKHSAVSFAVSSLLFVIFRKIQVSVACFATGILIDLDHIFDYYKSGELKEKLSHLLHPRKLNYLLLNSYKLKPARRVYKPLHSIELLIPITILYAFGIWNQIATGMLIGFLLHLIMDAMPLGHIGAVSLIYKFRKNFHRGSDIIRERLIKAGRNVNRCEVCDAEGEMIYSRERYWYIGFTKKDLDKITIMCPSCYDRLHNYKEQTYRGKK